MHRQWGSLWVWWPSVPLSLGQCAAIWLAKMERKLEGTKHLLLCNVFFPAPPAYRPCCWSLHVFTAFCFPQDFCSEGFRPACLNFAMVFQAPQVPKKVVKQIKKDDPAEKPFAEDPLFIQRRLLTSWPVFRLQRKLTYLKNHSEAWLSSGFFSSRKNVSTGKYCKNLEKTEKSGKHEK